MKQVSIIGFGRFGKTLYRLLKDDFAVVLYDRDGISSDGVKFTKQTITTKDLKEVYASDTVFYAVPVSEFEEVISSHRTHFREDQLLIDVLAVKLYPAQIFEKHLKGTQVQAMHTHPNYGPDSSKDGFADLPIIVNQFK